MTAGVPQDQGSFLWFVSCYFVDGRNSHHIATNTSPHCTLISSTDDEDADVLPEV